MPSIRSTTYSSISTRRICARTRKPRSRRTPTGGRNGRARPFPSKATAIHAAAPNTTSRSDRVARSEREVVFGAAACIAVAFDGNGRARPFLPPVGVLLERGFRVLAQIRLVEIEEYVVERMLGI